jgi:hypothetical protein
MVARDTPNSSASSAFIDVDAAGGDAVPGEGGPLDLGVLGDG